MPRELTPDEIRAADLGRQFRGYDREQTERLLADIAEAHANVLGQRDALSSQIEGLQRDQSTRDAEGKREVEELSARLQESHRRAADLDVELSGLSQLRSSELDEARALREELATAQTALEQHRAELVEHREVVARLRTREKALSEQVAMLESQLGEEGEAGSGKLQPEGALLDERAVRALGHLDRVVEIVEREARHEAERMLRKARERADEIVRSAEAKSALGEEGREEHPGAVGPTTDRDASSTDATSVGVGHGGEPRHVPEYDARPVWDLPGDLRPSGEAHEEEDGQVPPRLGFGEPSEPGA